MLPAGYFLYCIFDHEQKMIKNFPMAVFARHWGSFLILFIQIVGAPVTFTILVNVFEMFIISHLIIVNFPINKESHIAEAMWLWKKYYKKVPWIR